MVTFDQGSEITVAVNRSSHGKPSFGRIVLLPPAACDVMGHPAFVRVRYVDEKGLLKLEPAPVVDNVRPHVRASAIRTVTYQRDRWGRVCVGAIVPPQALPETLSYQMFWLAGELVLTVGQPFAKIR